MTRALIFAGGDAPGLGLADLPIADLVIAADSGLHHALDMGVMPMLLIGDLDSADPERVAEAESLGTEVVRYSADKDQTDLELALRAAVDRGCDDLVVVGGLGGRLDHLLANCALLTADRWAQQRVRLIDAMASVWIVRGERQLDVGAEAIVTLLAYGGPATVSTTGMRWDLDDATLVPGSSWGVSNEVVTPNPTVTTHSGVITAISPRL